MTSLFAISLVVVLCEASACTKIWSFSTVISDFGPSGVVLAPNGRTLYISASNYDTGKTYAVDTVTGNQTWVHTTSTQFSPLVLSPDSKTVFVVGVNVSSNTRLQSTLQALNAASGTQQWAFDMNGPEQDYYLGLRPAVAPNGHTVYAANFSEVHAVDATSGKQLWTFHAGDCPHPPTFVFFFLSPCFFSLA